MPTKVGVWQHEKTISFILIGALIMLSISGCGKQKYKLIFDGHGFESKKTEYAAGEKVTVYYDEFATDTDYHFYIDDDVKMEESSENIHAYIFTFTMPDHDVTLHMESRNSMEHIPRDHPKICVNLQCGVE